MFVPVPYLFFLLICLAWGASFILMDRASLAFGPASIGLLRLAGGALVVGLYCLFTRQWAKFTRRNWLDVAVVAFASNVFPYVMQPFLMTQAGEHAYFGLMVTLVPLATILVSVPMLGIRPTPRQLIGVLGGLACVGLIVFDGQQRGMPPWLLALALLVPLAYAVGNTYLKWKLGHLPAAPVTAAFLAIGASMLVPLDFSSNLLVRLDLAGPTQPQQLPLAMAAMAVLSLVCTGAALLMFTHLVKTQGPLFAGMVTYVVPMFALLWGQYDHETLTGKQLLGVGGILAMVTLVQWRAADKQESAAPATID